MAITKFKNEPFTDFSKAPNRKAMEKALKKIAGKLGKEYPIVIDGKEIRANDTFTSVNPSDPSQVIGTFQKGDATLAKQGVDAALKTFETWKDVPAKQRAEYLFKAAALMRKRKHEFSACMVYEVGKSWPEADGDTAEAIDFIEYYAREMMRLNKPPALVKLPGEKNELRYIPLGVGAIIPPWNFPLAILVGMSMAAVVAGNTIVLKPSSDSPMIGWMFFELMKEIGLPKGVINYVTGPGGAVGNTLVEHPQIRFISFTGSMEVGIQINERAAKVMPGQKWLKRVIAEMGGKDGIVVDEKTDLNAAAQATVASAFGFQGQKCSAASRAIVHEKVYDKFVQLVREKTEDLTVGPSHMQANFMGPVINKSSYDKILAYIDTAVREGGWLVAGGGTMTSQGYFIQPTVIADVKPKDTIAQEEIFGPVLAIIKVKSFDEGLDVANDTQFGLTGGVFTKDKKKIEKAKKVFHVGNFYVNRKITGAFVGAHPFGGFNMSGTDSKAGGYDYLQLLMQAKMIAEKI